MTGRAVVRMSIEDAEHYTPEQRAAIINSYPAHEREARAKGIPTLGSGRVFPVEEDSIKFKANASIPDHWAVLGALDFGWDHPTAAVLMAWDRDYDKLYVINAYRAKHQTAVLHAAALKPWGANLPWAWPHDGLQHDKGAGEQIATQYKNNGLKMLEQRATFEDGSNSVEAGVLEMLERMQTGRLMVAEHLTDWFDEFRLYHRKDGQIVKERDDLLSATRYGMMMKRYAVSARLLKKKQDTWSYAEPRADPFA